MRNKLIGIAVAIGLGVGFLPASPAYANSATYVGFNDVALACGVHDETGIGVGGWCFDSIPGGTRTITVDDASGLPVGIWVQWGEGDGQQAGLCGSGQFTFPGGQVLVFIDGPLFSVFDCDGTVPFSPVGTVGNIFIS